MTDPISERVIRTDITMSVAARDKEIHLLFSEKNQAGEPVPAYTANFLLSASDALVFGAQLADLAYEADTGLKVSEAQKLELVERHRHKLRDRLRVVLNSQREKKTINNASLARTLVDIMLAEVFQ